MMSPGSSSSSGYSSRMLTTAIARLLMWPGVPVTAWATMRPRRSNTALARSPASRTIGLNAARWSARACSLTVAIRLCQQISSSIGSNVRVMTRLLRRADAAGGDDAAVGADLDVPAGSDHRGRLAFFDDGRPVEPAAGAEVDCAVHRRVDGDAIARPNTTGRVANGVGDGVSAGDRGRGRPGRRRRRRRAAT